LRGYIIRFLEARTQINRRVNFHTSGILTIFRMFAVPGWSVSADTLKVDKDIPAIKENKKKRKRSAKSELPPIVDASNLGELWTQHFSIKTGASKSSDTLSKKARKRAKNRQGDGSGKEDLKSELRDSKESNTHQEPTFAEEFKTKSKKDSKVDPTKDNGPSKSNTDATIQQAQSAPSKLTPLQASMRQKLISSRFRYLNETLYTTPSASSFELFSQNPEFFNEYHEGFRRQVEAWPENPVDGFVQWIRERGVIKAPDTRDRHKNRNKRSQKLSEGDISNDDSPVTAVDSEALPRNVRNKLCTIADLGCGDGKLGYILSSTPPTPSLAKKLKLKVHSYDLASSGPHITVADIRSLPLEDNSTDIAIFCLALMGTNWIEFVEEAYRVLRWKGECWIAEVASRFGTPRSQRVEHSVGNRVKNKPNQKAKGKRGSQKPEEEEPILEDEETTSPQHNTDVSAFISVMKRRGFVLQGQVEMGNKMFVRMRFIKALPAARGKCFSKQQKEGKKKFIEDDADDISVEEERKVLKPCVYKTR
jgi:ribosomal RNA-processing protein 8